MIYQNHRSPASFLVSLGLHGGLLGWVAFGPAGNGERPKSLYEREIQPYEKKIVWYRLNERLPEIQNSTSRDPRPERARVKTEQSIVAGEIDQERPAPKIHLPDPVPPHAAPMPLPNAIALAEPPRIPRPFVAPPPAAPVVKDSPLPEAPRADAAMKVAAPPLVVSPKLPPRAFVPPPTVRLLRQAALTLPESPAASATVVEPDALPFSMTMPKARRPDFVPPPARKVEKQAVALPAAPEVAAAAVPDTLVRIPKGFHAPPTRPVERRVPLVAEDAPETDTAPALAIVGLNPVKTMVLPKPPAPSEAGFSAGPMLRKDGGDGGPNPGARLSVPGLSVKGARAEEPPPIMGAFSPTSRESLMAAARSVRPMGTPAENITGAWAAPPKTSTGGVRLAEPPDPRLAGRAVYSMSIQMPNITSFSGSWLVWFAERAPLAGLPALEINSPVPLRKVDPKYVPSAAAERIEGTVRLWATIRKDGHVDVLSVLRNLDARLDQSARQALEKWLFMPATRSGIAVDVDAVFEIPFHLAPRATK